MTDAFETVLGREEKKQLGSLALAHIGDAVYELLTRLSLLRTGDENAAELHRQTVLRVNAGAQARAAEKLQPLLTEEELDVFRRGRNTRVHGLPKNASAAEYHAATGLEALFGYLYLEGRNDRLSELFRVIAED